MSINDKIRIYELARELNLENNDILVAAHKLSISIKSHSSSITLNDAVKIKDFLNSNLDKDCVSVFKNYSNKNINHEENASNIRKTNSKILTEQQKEVVDWISKGNGNCLISSVAGSGKSTTIVDCIKRIPAEDKVYVLSFNTKIAKSMEENIVKQIPKRCYNGILTKKTQVRTLHATGKFLLDGKLKEFKNSEILNEISKDFYAHKIKTYNSDLKKFKESGFSEINPKPTKPKLRNIFKILKEYFQLSQVNLIDDRSSREEIIEFIEFYKIDIDITKDIDLIIKYTKNYFQKIIDIYELYSDINFDEMLYLPNRCEKKFNFPFRWIFIDECQDLSKAAIELIKKIGNKNSRFIFVGDEDQSINGFAGADIRSMDQIKKTFKPKLFELTNTFRCAKQITKFAKRYVPRINCLESMKEGTVSEIKDFENMPELDNNDAILARKNASLITCAIKLIREKKNFNFPPKIQKQIKDNLSDLKEILDTAEFHNNNIIFQLESIIQDESDSIEFNGCSKDKVERIEFCESLSKLCEKDRSIKTFSDLENYLNIIINQKKGPLLSTIHTQKGEEFEKVVIADFDLMPSSKPNEPEWAAVQEMNVLYVAVTRAKSSLYLNSIGTESRKNFDIYNSVNKPKVNEAEFGVKKREGILETEKSNKKNKILREAIDLRIKSGIERFVEGHEFQYGAKFYRIVKKGGEIIIACSLSDYTFKSFKLINCHSQSNSANDDFINSIKEFTASREFFDGNPIGIFDNPLSATKDSISGQWSNLRQEWNPKKNKNPIAQQIFDFINSAYNKAIKALGNINLKK